MARLSIEQVREIITQAGFELVSGEYKNLKSVLICRCVKGHEVPTSVFDLRKRPVCPVCESYKSTEEEELKIGEVPKKKKRRVLAIDNATQISGWAVFEGDELISSGIFKAKEANETIDRIIEVGRWMRGMLQAWEIDALGLENVQYEGNPKVLIALARLLGSLEVIGYECLETHPYVVPSVTWRSYCGIKGKTRAKLKEGAQAFVKQRYGFVASQDRADAICIGVYVSNADQMNRPENSWG